MLEVGAGTGSLTEKVLPVLPQDRTEYLFTDNGPAFLAAAKKRFADWPILDFQTFDIEKSPEDQGIEPHGYDLILATKRDPRHVGSAQHLGEPEGVPRRRGAC